MISNHTAYSCLSTQGRFDGVLCAKMHTPGDCLNELQAPRPHHRPLPGPHLPTQDQRQNKQQLVAKTLSKSTASPPQSFLQLLSQLSQLSCVVHLHQDV
jgi:hypothetical protein